MLPHVEGTKVRGRVYHLNLRIPAEAAAAYPGQTHLRGSLKTSDPKTARQRVIVRQAELYEAAQHARKRELLAEALADLPPDQRAVFDEAGSVSRLRAQFDRTATARAFMIAGGAVTESDLMAVDTSDTITQTPNAMERALAEAAHNAELQALDRVADAEAKTLRAVGEDVKAPLSFGLRELVDALAPLTGVRPDTVKLHHRIVSRFIEFTGDLPLAELTIAHLREFATAYADFPAQTASAELRGQNCKDLIRIAKAKGLPRITDTARRQHIDTLKGLLAKAPSQGYLPADPWASFDLILPRGKHANAKEKPRAPFTGDQAAAILADAATYHPGSIDRWAPLLACYQGARREEIGQMRGCDVFKESGVWCIRVTDEDADQKLKTESSVRTLPLHHKVIESGFIEFAANRPADDWLFVNDTREGLKPMEPNASNSRVTPAFGKRFATRLRVKLGITDSKLVFHSFRHLWEDVADGTTMYDTHRRDLAGRSKRGDSQASYGSGPRVLALKDSLDRMDPLGWNPDAVARG